MSGQDCSISGPERRPARFCNRPQINSRRLRNVPCAAPRWMLRSEISELRWRGLLQTVEDLLPAFLLYALQ